MRFLIAGGGTGGHVIPALAVARELQARGHETLFVGTEAGLEARLVPAAGFPIHYIEIGGLNRVGALRALRTLAQLPLATLRLSADLRRWAPDAVFSMGGYVAGPVMLAAARRRVPMVLMEPNAVPGLVNRHMGRFAFRALINFQETACYFPRGKAELTGVPVRPEFFALPAKAPGPKLAVLVTGGSQGSRRLNTAARESWPLFREANYAVRFIHQAGRQMDETLRCEFAQAGMEGEIVPFIDDMPAAFGSSDLVVCRAGAGAVAEIAAAGKPAILVPFPFAADDHQRKNAEILARAGAARLVPDAELTGRRLFEELTKVDAGSLTRMGQAARAFARPRAAERAAEIVIEAGRR